MIKKIQILTPDLLEELSQIWLQANLEAHAFITDTYWRTNYQVFQELLPTADLYVFSHQNQILGFLGLVDTYVAGLFVNKEVRGTGIGKRLVDEVKQECDILSLSVYEKNQAAYHFYLTQGFVKTGESLDQATKEKEYQMTWKKNG